MYMFGYMDGGGTACLYMLYCAYMHSTALHHEPTRPTFITSENTVPVRTQPQRHYCSSGVLVPMARRPN